MAKIWVDDIRPAPSRDYVVFTTTNEALKFIINNYNTVELIDLDHDSGDLSCYTYGGGDFINILNELERLSKVKGMDFSHIKFKFHSANPIGVANMRRIIERNGWTEVK